MKFLTRIAALPAALLLVVVPTIASAAPAAALGGGLQELVAAWESGDSRLGWMLDLHVVSRGGDPLVKIRIADGMKLEQVVPGLSDLGFQLTAVSRQNPQLIEGYLPLWSARGLAHVAGIASAHATQRPLHNAGAVQSQAVALQKADVAQANGFDGSGIRIGALSDSYDACDGFCFTTASDDVASGDLPPGVVVLADLPPGFGSDEGRGMLQLIHDVAPGSALGFATAFNGEIDFANNILALRADFHADVITDDVIYFDEPMYSDGILAQAVDIVSQDGAAYFSSAGNNGLEAYEATYRPVSFARAKALVAAGKSNLKLEQIPEAIRPASLHDFGEGAWVSLSQTFTTAADNIMSFQWDEPFFVGKVQTDYNIYVFDSAGNWMDPFSPAFPGFYTTDDNTATDEAFEILELLPFAGEIHGGANASDYQIVIGKMNDGPARHIKYVNVNGLGVSERQAAPSSWGHAVASGGQAVAATYYAIPGFPEDFSATGPATIYFDQNGNKLRHPDVRFVPQLTAADGVDTTFFGFDSDGNGLPNFFGTSAAAPNAAAVAALVLQAAGGPGSVRPSSIYDLMQQTASPIPVPNDRSWSAAFAGPVLFTATGDWVRWSRYFGLAVQPFTGRKVTAVSFDTSGTALTWSLNPTRFHVGTSNGVTPADVTFTVSPDARVFTLNFKPGTFGAGDSLRFGMSVFDPLQGTTQLDPDHFRGVKITVTLDNGKTQTGEVFAAPRERINRFTGFGLVDAAAATKAASHHGHHGHHD